MLDAAVISQMIEEDFNEFDFADKPMGKYCAYNRTKHIQMATQIVLNAFHEKRVYLWSEVEDIVHGLNHLFFNGVAAGQSFEWFKGKEEK